MPEEIITGLRSPVLVPVLFQVSVAWNMSRRKNLTWLITAWCFYLAWFNGFVSSTENSSTMTATRMIKDVK
jgi:predicted membrane metal-binding protein